MKRIVVCGSMIFLDTMIETKKVLEERGYEVLIPEDPRDITEPLTKKEYSMLHFNKIANELTDAILVINSNKNGKDNYIGANSFAEIALAFYFDKDIYLLNDIYEPYKDELGAWNTIPLKGNLENLYNESSDL